MMSEVKNKKFWKWTDRKVPKVRDQTSQAAQTDGTEEEITV